MTISETSFGNTTMPLSFMSHSHLCIAFTFAIGIFFWHFTIRRSSGFTCSIMLLKLLYFQCFCYFKLLFGSNIFIGIDQTFKITILKLFSSTKPQVRALFYRTFLSISCHNAIYRPSGSLYWIDSLNL